MENASRAFLDAVRASMRQIRMAIGATVINPRLLTAAERIQYEGYLLANWDESAARNFLESGRAGLAYSQHDH